MTGRRVVSLVLVNAIALRADATTDATSVRRQDLLRGKKQAVVSFFDSVRKYPADVSPLDVKTWQASLEASGLKASIVYWKISRISSFYCWAMESPELREVVKNNPALLNLHLVSRMDCYTIIV
jgi:site-specific recombinase XerD